MVCLNYEKLKDEHTATEFRRRVCQEAGESFTELTAAVQKAASILPKKDRARPGWFKDKEDVIIPLIDARNSAMSSVYKRRTRSNIQKLQNARKNLKRMLMQAKNDWIKKAVLYHK